MTGGDQGVVEAVGLDFALAGYADMSGGERVAVYDTAKVIELLMTRDAMAYDEAVEFFDFNIAAAYVGPGTPIFMEPVREE